MKFFNIKKVLHKNALLLSPGEYKGWYSQQEVVEILKNERSRSAKTGLPFSFVRIELPEANGSKKKSVKNLNAFSRKLIPVISDNTRNVDIKFFIDARIIGIVLLDTSLEGAKIFVTKISGIFNEYFQAIHRRKYIYTLRSLTIRAYPLSKLPGYINHFPKSPSQNNTDRLFVNS